MKFNRSDTILRELREHLPFTLVVSLLAGVLVALGYIFGGISSGDFFEVVHPLHVLVSAAATAAIFRKYKRSFVEAVLVGIVGAVLIGSVSDVLLPFLAGNLFGLETVLHLPIFENPFLIIGGAVVGGLIGVSFGLFKLSHSLHVFLSVFASLFYLLGFSSDVSIWVVLVLSLVVFLVVYVPCCISDIVFPIFFIKKPCRDCGHWHD